MIWGYPYFWKHPYPQSYDRLGWDLDHQSYSREGSGFLGKDSFSATTNWTFVSLAWISYPNFKAFTWKRQWSVKMPAAWNRGALIADWAVKTNLVLFKSMELYSTLWEIIHKKKQFWINQGLHIYVILYGLILVVCVFSLSSNGLEMLWMTTIHSEVQGLFAPGKRWKPWVSRGWLRHHGEEEQSGQNPS